MGQYRNEGIYDKGEKINYLYYSYFMIFSDFGDTKVSAATSETKKIRVTGDIYYYIKENGSNEADSVRKILINEIS